ncbi:MAG: nucleotidyltransferase substrate binding protein [Bacteroidota bacterium]
MHAHDVRWKQRFQNFIMAYQQLTNAVQLSEWSELERAGLIQIFEFTFELGWKTIKDYLQEQELPTQFPKDAINQAFQAGMITDGELWLDMLHQRNLMSHTYSQQNAETALRLIIDLYYPALRELHEYLEREI